MRKDISLPLLALAGGLAGFFTRRWQLASAYLPETGLFVHRAPATLALMGLLGLLALAFLLLVQHKEGPEDFLPAFGCPEAGQMTLLAAAGLLLTLAGVLGLKSGLEALQLWRAAPELYPVSNAGAQILASALCLPGGLGILFLGRMAYRGELNDAACRLASFPAFAGLVWLFASHLKNGTEPVLMKYGFQLAAILLFTLAHYYIAAFLFGRPRRRLTLFLTLMGVVVGLTALADWHDLFSVAVLAFVLSGLTFAHALLRNTFGPPWPERMPSSGEEENT